MEFHVHINASLLVVGALLAQNIIGRNDQLVVYASILLNNLEYNYSTTEKKSFSYGLCISLGIICWEINCVLSRYMALVYLVNQPQVLGRIVRWLLLFREYDFIVMYKLDKTHVVADVLSILFNIMKPS
jgi:hypothetical protein